VLCSSSKSGDVSGLAHATQTTGIGFDLTKQLLVRN